MTDPRVTDAEAPPQPDVEASVEVIKDLDVPDEAGEPVVGGQSVGGPRPTH